MAEYNAHTLLIPEYLTVKTLREYLDKAEDLWTDQDIQYLGNFEDTPLRVIYPSGGIGDAKLVYDGGLGFIFLDKAEEV